MAPCQHTDSEDYGACDWPLYKAKMVLPKTVWITTWKFGV